MNSKPKRGSKSQVGGFLLLRKRDKVTTGQRQKAKQKRDKNKELDQPTFQWPMCSLHAITCSISILILACIASQKSMPTGGRTKKRRGVKLLRIVNNGQTYLSLLSVSVTVYKSWPSAQITQSPGPGPSQQRHGHLMHHNHVRTNTNSFF